MRPILPARAKPYAFAATQAFVTTGVSTFIASGAALPRWLVAWALAWILLVPLVLLMAPFLWRLLSRLCDQDIGDPR
jgi:hypothetical protein